MRVILGVAVLAVAGCAPTFPVCPAQQTFCPFTAPVRGVSGSCVSLDVDLSHCGSCDTRCFGAQRCVGGVCEGCGAADCFPACENTNSNPLCCGAPSSLQCGQGLSCIGGRCQPDVVMVCSQPGGVGDCTNPVRRAPSPLPLAIGAATHSLGRLILADDTTQTLSVAIRSGLDWALSSTTPIPRGPTRFAGDGLPWALSAGEGVVWRFDRQLPDGGLDPSTRIYVGEGSIALAASTDSVWVAMGPVDGGLPRVLQFSIADGGLALAATHPLDVPSSDGGVGIPVAIALNTEPQVRDSVYVALRDAPVFVRLTAGAAPVQLPIGGGCPGTSGLVMGIQLTLFPTHWVALVCADKVVQVEPKTSKSSTWLAPAGFRPSFLARSENVLLVGDAQSGRWTALAHGDEDQLIGSGDAPRPACAGSASAFVVFP
ncbi:MAG: hypothetical protein Q8L48_30980 [Archangium sp.]|nr:hypothetical protein [Archangium sp.]